MKSITTIIFVLSFGLLFGQESLTQKDLPQLGNGGLYRSFQQELKDFAKFSGTDVAWDYSLLINTQDSKPIEWLPITKGSTEEQAMYPNATMIEINNTGNKFSKFFEITNNSYKFLGFNVAASNFKLKETFDYYVFPMEYGKKYTSHFAYSDTNNGEGVYSIVYDGTGSLKLPEATYDSVYRVFLQTKTVFPSDKKDTVITNEYQFFKRESGLLLFRVLEFAPGNSDDSRMYSFLYYVSPITNIDLDLSQKATLYPNPATNNISLEATDQTILNYEIMDLSGKTLLKAPYSRNIDISKLSSGNYFIKGETLSGKNIIKQFVKQ